mmetsp:Transcript_10535/g.13674  ORF Transcript_10535/g.13674 Transcript_10535/m.13674 type:complete len:101 (+) Transcript_10535:960-1262(+)
MTAKRRMLLNRQNISNIARYPTLPTLQLGLTVKNGEEGQRVTGQSLKKGLSGLLQVQLGLTVGALSGPKVCLLMKDLIGSNSFWKNKLTCGFIICNMNNT